MSNSNSQGGGCCGCLVLLVSIPVFWFIGHQNYSYQSTGKFDWSIPKIKFGLPEFGTPKSVQLCADYLKEAPYADNVSIEDKTISFLVDEKGVDSLGLTFIPNKGAAADNNASTTDNSTLRWSGINKKVSTDIRFKCKAPVTVNYTYLYVRKRFTGQVVLQDPKR